MLYINSRESLLSFPTLVFILTELSLHIEKGNTLDPNTWDTFIQQSPQGCIYAMHGYIECIREDWQAYILKEKGEWVAVMPFILNKKGPFNFLPQAPLTQHWGIFFTEETGKPYAILSKQGRIITRICEEIADISLLNFHLSPQFDYPLPFHWQGFELHTRYTYQIDLKGDPSRLDSHLESSHKRQIRKANKTGIQFYQEESLEALKNLYAQNLAHGHDLSAGDNRVLPILEKLLTYLQKTGQGYLCVGRDSQQEIYAAGLFAFACGKMYYLSGAYHPARMSSGAMTALIWHNIQAAKEKGLEVFDFEGSMIAGIEQFFRKFGAKPIPYLQLYKNNLPLWAKWLHKLIS